MTRRIVKFAFLVAISFWLRAAALGQTPGAKLWEFSAPGPVSSPAIGPDGTIYFTAAGNLCAADQNGSNRWTRFDNFGGTPAVDPNGTLYVALTAGFRAISSEGLSVWVVNSAGFRRFPDFGLGNGAIYLPADNVLIAINRNGTQRWIQTDESHSPSVGLDGTIYYLGTRSIRAVRSNGKLINTYFYLGNEAITPMAIGADGTIYCGYEGGKLCAVNPDLTRRWLYNLDDEPSGTYLIKEPAIGPDGTIYFPTLRKGLCAMSPSGTNLWRFKADVEVPFIDISPPAVAEDGTIYVASGTNFFAINPDGTEKWRFSARYEFHSSPAIAGNGTVYVGNDDGRLYALKGTARLARSAWPMEGHDLRRSRKASCFRGFPCFETPLVTKPDTLETILLGDEGQEYRVMTSTDLINWTLHTNSASANGVSVISATTSESQKLYKTAP